MSALRRIFHFHEARRRLTAKYPAEIGKGFLLAGVISYVTNAAGIFALIAQIWVATCCFAAAYLSTKEEENNERI
uniref:Uncharacterized protein n=1 Tax=Candidatus Kentrum sp. LFY TaxID=2126342 RepID=A0A450UHN0_9GAMM|nr:MAG: hypothetical protein BECKLFY1418A_GA0070994_10206 [Candidatus Kentron sp. LFY]